MFRLLTVAAATAVLLAGCGGGTAYKATGKSSSEVARALVDAGLTCKDDPGAIVSTGPDMQATAWSCHLQGAEHPYFAARYFSAPEASMVTREEECQGLSDGDHFNRTFPLIDTPDVQVYSNSMVQAADQRPTDIQTATAIKEVEPVLKSVADALGTSLTTVDALCS